MDPVRAAEAVLAELGPDDWQPFDGSARGFVRGARALRGGCVLIVVADGLYHEATACWPQQGLIVRLPALYAAQAARQAAHVLADPGPDA